MLYKNMSLQIIFNIVKVFFSIILEEVSSMLRLILSTEYFAIFFNIYLLFFLTFFRVFIFACLNKRLFCVFFHFFLKIHALKDTK